MSYRDETAVLRERLLALDAEHAALEGTAQGLRFRSAATGDDAKRLRLELRVERAKGRVRRTTYRLLGGAVAISVVVALCVASGALFHACSNVSEVVIVEEALRGEERLEGCQVAIDDTLFSSCFARAWCDHGVVWEGAGSCNTGAQGVQFWSDESAGAERFTYVRGLVSQAVYRDDGGESIVFRLPRGDTF